MKESSSRGERASQGFGGLQPRQPAPASPLAHGDKEEACLGPYLLLSWGNHLSLQMQSIVFPIDSVPGLCWVLCEHHTNSHHLTANRVPASFSQHSWPHLGCLMPTAGKLQPITLPTFKMASVFYSEITAPWGMCLMGPCHVTSHERKLSHCDSSAIKGERKEKCKTPFDTHLTVGTLRFSPSLCMVLAVTVCMNK